MSDREKLIELLGDTGEMLAVDEAVAAELGGCENGWITDKIGFIADHLISNGVTAQQWTPVSDPPKTGGSYLVTTEKGAVCTAHFYKNGDVGKWSPGRTIVVTHWKPLPMPAKRCE